MSQSGGPGAPGQPPPGPPDWRSAPQQPPPQAPDAPPSWQSAPQAPQSPGAPAAPPSWQSAPQAPQAPASWQSAPKAPVAPELPPPPPPSWSAGLTSTAPVPGPAGFFYADVPNRIVAYIIDMILLAVIGFVSLAAVSQVMGAPSTISSTTNGLVVEVNLASSLVLAIVNTVIGALYFILQWSRQRATMGMRVLGLQIGAESDGRSISTAQGFSRWLIFGIPGILAQFSLYLNEALGFILSLVGIIWLIALLISISQSPTKQGYHDRYAKTIMVKAARRAA